MSVTERQRGSTARPDGRSKPSARRMAANRRNARKSTGPRSERGKAVASQNARTHGLLSSCVVLDWSDFEDPEDFRVLREALSKDLQPEGALEELYVEKIAVGLWRLQRMWGFERHRIVRALEDEGIKEFAKRESATEERRVQAHLMFAALASQYRAEVETLRAAMEKLALGLSGETVPGEALSAAIQELEAAPLLAPIPRILSDDGDRVDSPEEKGVEVRALGEFRHLLTSVIRNLSQGLIPDEDVGPLLAEIYQKMHGSLEMCERNLEGFVKTLDLDNASTNEDGGSPSSEEKCTNFLQRYGGPPLDGLDVFVRYETSVERRLQKDIETLYALQAIRRGSGRKLLGSGAIQS